MSMKDSARSRILEYSLSFSIVNVPHCLWPIQLPSRPTECKMYQSGRDGKHYRDKNDLEKGIESTKSGKIMGTQFKE